MNYANKIDSLIQGVSSAIGKPIPRKKYEILDRGLPHTQPTGLPTGKMAVYMFLFNEEFLKIGKANYRSNARFCNHHYGLSAPSTLAKSLLADNKMINLSITPSNVKDWIKTNCRRIDIIIDADLGVFALDLIEAIMHYKFEPRYEGFVSQR
ncbi:MAG: hypothetical protein PHZ11_07720 [Desulfitobacteriaceae bacterium]|nr:hypothetical protein [Desulfitobacteriaceae bacterium]MDD4346756.1 hypothetical protein [Desulfitobacteriaceae bacterium]MDD4402011.1 hypothetical protein [Desulfitobacteriaceae bacterium]